MTWPIYEHFQHETKPTPDNALIVFYPFTGGSYLATVLSCSEAFYGKSFIQNVIDNYNQSLENVSHPEGPWKATEFKNHPYFFKLNARHWFFDQYLEHKKPIILIDYTLKNEETAFILKRKEASEKYAKNTLTDAQMADLQYRYQVELFKFLNYNNKPYHRIPFSSFLNAKKFAAEIHKLCNFLEIPLIDENDIIKIHNNYMRSVLRFCKNSLS